MTDTGAAADEPGAPEDRVQDRPGRPSTVEDRSGGQPSGEAAAQTWQGAPRAGVAPAARQLLGNRYRLVDRLGQGGMGTVWKAHDEVIGRDVAVKEPRLPDNVPDSARDVVFARLEREARAAAQVDHPSVVGIHDVVSVNGQPWIVMELIRGQSLDDVLTQGTLPPAEAARVTLPVVGALAAAHAHGVLHRDVKPPNIMLGPSGRIVLTDFGVAHIEGETQLTQTGALVGSPEYIAPELVLGQAPGPESDLFSLGVLLYTSIEGFSPFRRQLPQATLQAVLRSEPQTPELAGELAPLIMQLLSKEPRSRPAAPEVEDVLGRVAAQAQLPPVALKESTRRPRAGLRTGGTGRTGGSGGTGGVARTGGMGRTGEAAVSGRSGSGSRGWARPVGAAAAASVVTGSLVAALLWPGADGSEGSDGAKSGDVQGASAQGQVPGSTVTPDGWRKEEVKKLGASIAVPPDFRRATQNSENAMTFRKNGDGGHQLILVRDQVEPPDGPPAQTGAYWYRKYRANPEFENPQVTLEEGKGLNGAETTSLTMTYRNTGMAQLHRKKEMYFEADGHTWTVVVDWDIKDEDEPGGDDVFDGAVKSFHAAG